MKRDKFFITINGKQVGVKFSFKSAKTHVINELRKLNVNGNAEYFELISDKTESIKKGDFVKECVSCVQTWRNYRTGETCVFTIEKQPGE